MKAKVFPEANFDFKRPQSMTEDQCYDLPTFRGSEQIGPDPVKDKFPCIISAWDVTDEDLDRIRISKTLWLVITGTGMPPVRIQSEHPFIINKGEETAGGVETTEAALRRISGMCIRYEDVIKRCQRILGEQIDPLSKMEPEEAISQLLSILDNKEFHEFMDKTPKELINDCLPEAMRIVRKELSKDKEPGSYYHSWQSNLAMMIADELDVAHPDNTRHGIGNRAAQKFLDLLIGDAGDLKTVTIDSGQCCGQKEVVMQSGTKTVNPGSREREEEIIRYGGRNAGKTIERDALIALGDAEILLRECIPATLDNPELQKRIIDYFDGRI